MNFLKIILALLFLPLVTNAQNLLGGTRDIALSFAELVGILVPVAFIASLLLFFWGVAKYIKSEGDGKSEGKKIMVWGVVAIFVISSVWGIVFFIRGELGIRDIRALPIPSIAP